MTLHGKDGTEKEIVVNNNFAYNVTVTIVEESEFLNLILLKYRDRNYGHNRKTRPRKN